MPSFGNSVDSSCAISSPLGPGMWLSSTSTSGCRSRTTRMVASPSPASPTSSMPCARESLNRMSLRVASSSSATTTRMLIGSLYGEPLAPEKGRRRERDGQRTGRDEEPRQPGARDDRSEREHPASAAPIREAAEERRHRGGGERGRRERGADGELDRKTRRP